MDTYDSNVIYWIWLSQINGVGPVIGKALLDTFKTPQNIYKATRAELVNIDGIGNTIANIIFNSKSLVKAEEILRKCEKSNILVLTYGDSLYPVEVKDIKKAPIVLYYRGRLIEDSVGVAIVGSRRCTEYGKKLTVEAAEFLANHFPMRNRLISAWCKKLLIVEAGEKSGALYTAAFAKEQNRRVFAAPNSIYSIESIGTNRLIKEGSGIYLNPSQLLLDNTRVPVVDNREDIAPIENALTALEKIILAKIKDNPMTLNEILFNLKEDRSDVLATISIMELMGKIINVGGVFK